MISSQIIVDFLFEILLCAAENRVQTAINNAMPLKGTVTDRESTFRKSGRNEIIG
jgi:hypothetical protein